VPPKRRVDVASRTPVSRPQEHRRVPPRTPRSSYGGWRRTCPLCEELRSDPWRVDRHRRLKSSALLPALTPFAKDLPYKPSWRGRLTKRVALHKRSMPLKNSQLNRSRRILGDVRVNCFLLVVLGAFWRFALLVSATSSPFFNSIVRFRNTPCLLSNRVCRLG